MRFAHDRDRAVELVRRRACWPFGGTALSTTSSPPCRSRPSVGFCGPASRARRAARRRRAAASDQADEDQMRAAFGIGAVRLARARRRRSAGLLPRLLGGCLDARGLLRLVLGLFVVLAASSSAARRPRHRGASPSGRSRPGAISTVSSPSSTSDVPKMPPAVRISSPTSTSRAALLLAGRLRRCGRTSSSHMRTSSERR